MKKDKMIFAWAGILACLAIFGQDADLVQVKGKGTGETEEIALKDAYRDAVETAVGLYVDAEQMVKNDQLIKDEILTQSNAYIEDYKEIGRKTSNGLTTITILAQVRKQKLTKRISGTMEAKTFKVGAGLKKFHAQETTVAARGGDGAAILKKELESWNLFEQLYEVTLASAEGIPVGDMSGDVLEIAYLFKMEVNRDKYFEEFVPRIEQVFSQLSTKEPQDFRVDASRRPDMYLRRYISGEDRANALGGRGDTLVLNGLPLGVGSIERPYQLKNGVEVFLITEANKALTVVKGKRYALDSQCAQQYVEWKYDGNMDAPRYVVKFCDGNGRSLAETEIVFGGGAFGGYKRQFENELLTGYNEMKEMKFVKAMGRRSTGRRSSASGNGAGADFAWKLTPWVHGDYAAYYQWFSFKLAKDDLPKVDTIKVELAKGGASGGSRRPKFYSK